MARRKRKMRHRLIDIAHRFATGIEHQVKWMVSRCLAAAWRTFGRKSPSVVVDGRRRHAGRLRAAIRRGTRIYARGVGAELPPGLMVVVQRVVFEGRQLNGLLQAFDSPGGRRYVIHLALSVNGRQVAEDELLSALRHQVAQVLGDAVGQPALSVPLDLEVPRLRTNAAVVELRPDASAPEDGHERTAIPIERIEHKAS
jgi:hypothetical protein